MTEAELQSKAVLFTEADRGHNRITAVLITKDPETNEIVSVVETSPGNNPPSEDAVALLRQSVELANL